MISPYIGKTKFILKVHPPDMLGATNLEPHQAFGRALRQARLAAGLTQEGLSLESGVQRNFISLIELGQNQPTITTIFKLSVALNVTPSELIAATETILEIS